MNKPSTTKNETLWSDFFHFPTNWIFASGLVAVLPLLSVQCRNLWARPHYQFFPLAWFALAYLIYSRSKLSPTTSLVRRRIGLSIGLTFVLSLLCSIALNSPWLAHVTLIILVLAWMILQLGDLPWHLPVAWITLLVVTLPLPRNLDSRLVQSLQQRSTSAASSLMDLSGIPHFAKGNVIEMRSKELFVDEACSGVDSLYSLAAVALLLAIWNRTSLLLSVCTFLTVPLWAWLGNITRLYTIGILLDKTGIDWSHGWQHTVLGLLVFMGSFTCLMTVQIGLASLFSPFPNKSITSNFIHTLFNGIVCWPGDAFRRKASRHAPRPNPNGLESTPNSLDTVLSKQKVYWVSFAFLFLGSISALPVLGIGPWSTQNTFGQRFTSENVERFFVSNLLALDSQEFQQTGFKVSHRERASFYGEHSATWNFMDGERELQISLDFPFSGFHGLEECYILSGSELTNTIDSIEMKTGERDYVVYEGQFIDPQLQDTYLCFTEFSSTGEPVLAAGTFGRGVFMQSEHPTTFQVQLLVSFTNDLSETERIRYRKLLLKVSEALFPVIEKLSLE